MEFRKMVTITLYMRQQKRHWCKKFLTSNIHISLYFFYFFNFIFELYIIVLVLPNIEMSPPQVYLCSPSWTLFPPPSPYLPSGSSQCTSPKHPVSCIEPGLATHFIHDIIHVSVLTVASWLAYRFLKRQVRWSGIPISFRIFHSFLWSTQSKALV